MRFLDTVLGVLLGFAGGWLLARRQDRRIPRERLYDDLLPNFESHNYMVDRQKLFPTIERTAKLLSRGEQKLANDVGMKLAVAVEAAGTKDRGLQDRTKEELDEAADRLMKRLKRKLNHSPPFSPR